MAGVKLQHILVSAKRRSPSYFAIRFMWEANRVWRRLGWSALVGIVCGSFALLAYWKTHALMEQQESLERKLQSSLFADGAKPTNEPIQSDMASQISAFYAFLPPHDAIPDQLKRLINLAEKSDVVLSQAEYKPQPELNADFLRYQIILPVKASYPNVQTFILSALKELPTLTLESVAFKREKIESGEVEARIQYILLVKKPADKVGQR